MAPRVLLTSVFKPFGRDDLYGRRDSKIELYHNQITKYQGVFSLRAFQYSFGLHLIAQNIEVPTTVLDFPTWERFQAELRQGYDVVGIGSITPNFQKVKRMAEEIRRLSPRSKIVLGGFCATIPHLDRLAPVDHICIGDGIGFMRELLGLPREYVFQDPGTPGEGGEVLGFPLFWVRYPVIVIGLGCSYGCEFCAPSHNFGGRHVRFYTRGRDLFEMMVKVVERHRSNFIGFIGDDNFLLDLPRAEELRQCVRDSGRVFKVLMFSSADRIRQFGPEKLADMGVGIVWIGRESKYADFAKNQGINLAELVAELRSYGIKVILSSILLLDKHTPENIEEDIAEHLACRPVFSQFAHLAPLPGTPLYQRMEREGRILTGIPYEEWHAFKQPWFIHPRFSLAEAEKVQERAYLRDFHELGPSLMRFIEAEFEGWKNLRHASDPYQRLRAADFAREMWKNRIILRAMEQLAPTPAMAAMIRSLRRQVEKEFGSGQPFSWAAAQVLFGTGRFREFRTRHWGDELQPRTRVVRYHQVPRGGIGDA